MRAFWAILTFEFRQQGRTPLFAGVLWTDPDASDLEDP